MFYSIKELVEQADLDFQGNVAELMIATEYPAGPMPLFTGITGQGFRYGGSGETCP